MNLANATTSGISIFSRNVSMILSDLGPIVIVDDQANPKTTQTKCEPYFPESKSW